MIQDVMDSLTEEELQALTKALTVLIQWFRKKKG